MKAVKLSELIEAAEFDSDTQVTRVDLQNGCVVAVSEEVFRAVEEDEAALEGLPDWQKSEVAIARLIVADAGERFVDAPAKFDFHEYREMERFIGTLPDGEATNRLWRAIKGRGAFRCFKDTASDLGVLDQWYRFRDDALKTFAVAWAEARKVPFEDDVKPKPLS